MHTDNAIDRSIGSSANMCALIFYFPIANRLIAAFAGFVLLYLRYVRTWHSSPSSSSRLFQGFYTEIARQQKTPLVKIRAIWHFLFHSLKANRN